jgi:hypothetical protein
MRLEIGPDGKIIGTRRVSPNGQVSGLTEFAGREVLVILPGAGAPESSSWGTPEAVAQAVEEQMRQAYQRYELLQKLYATPWEATRSFVRSAFGSSAPDLVAEVDRWVKEQLRTPPSANPSRSNPSPKESSSSTDGGRSKSGRKRPGSSGGSSTQNQEGKP